MGKYGLPYMGSKSSIADKIIAVLPAGDRFIDLFGGGGAMTHAAALSGKYGEVVYSDADPLACEFITRAMRGDYSPERFTPRWVSRDEFLRKKDEDPYIRYCWSFGNSGKAYLYGRHIEGLKRMLFEWVVYGHHATFIAGLGVPVADAPDGLAERRAARIPCYVSSYELGDPRFRLYHEFKKTLLLCATKTCSVIERLYASRYAAKEKI